MKTTVKASGATDTCLGFIVGADIFAHVDENTYAPLFPVGNNPVQC